MFHNQLTITTIYNVLVTHKLDYYTVLWSPIFNNNIDKLEYLQRKSLKYLSFKVDYFYPPLADAKEISLFFNQTCFAAQSVLLFSSTVQKNVLKCLKENQAYDQFSRRY